MSKFELKLPKMGESVAEATLTAWLKDIGDSIDCDEAIVEDCEKSNKSPISLCLHVIMKQSDFIVFSLVIKT